MSATADIYIGHSTLDIVILAAFVAEADLSRHVGGWVWRMGIRQHQTPSALSFPSAPLSRSACALRKDSCLCWMPRASDEGTLRPLSQACERWGREQEAAAAAERARRKALERELLAARERVRALEARAPRCRIPSTLIPRWCPCRPSHACRLGRRPGLFPRRPVGVLRMRSCLRRAKRTTHAAEDGRHAGHAVQARTHVWGEQTVVSGSALGRQVLHQGVV